MVPPCVEWCETDNRATIPWSKHSVSPCLATLPECQTDAKKILTPSPQRTGGDHQDILTWMKTIQQDLKSNNLSLNEAIDVAQNHPLWRLMSMFGAKHS